ncbi:methyltransferase [Puniceicoccales bacterium CK1056]|uniref:Methyltransferase n=1 Tax=Oceanipulchritudo coccoides TaxID=2706888 RepID=A0A6B2LZC6_9BACT|nr:RsmD family RNA methyltransferase [Oceanipulchritudo coccoides]NDV60845.1 methyltransferase [Oceanipulchritudo coccoides]
MRITGGKAGGIPITTGRAEHVRPATDRMREAVFSSLGEQVEKARFVDLFAGSGSYGLEALSRGATGGIFVEKHPRAVEAITRNIQAVMKSLGNPEGVSTKVIRRDVLRFNSNERFNLIFMDPPYDLARSHGPELMKLTRALLNPEGPALLIYELPGDLSIPAAGWSCRRRIGKSGTNEPSIAILEAVD